jgi:uncharacterized membrane-anchored protein
MNRRIATGLILAIVLQFLVLSGIYVNAALPMWTGTEIRVKTVPVDPRSMFRGNYARLSYAFSRLQRKQFPGDAVLRNGEVAYVSLKPGADGLYVPGQVSLEPPGDGLFIRGRISSRHNWMRGLNSFPMKYGIEAFFAPKERALQLEKDLRDGGVAVLMVSPGGKARLMDVIAK